MTTPPSSRSSAPTTPTPPTASSPPNRTSSPTTASRLLAQLSFNSNNPNSFSRAASLLHRLRARKALSLLDANSLSLATKALRLFDAVLRHLCRAPRDLLSPSSLPDTAALNAALSACADAGDGHRFRQLFDEMHQEWNAAPDALTYNIVIKMHERQGVHHAHEGIHEHRPHRRRRGHAAGDAARRGDGARKPAGPCHVHDSDIGARRRRGHGARERRARRDGRSRGSRQPGHPQRPAQGLLPAAADHQGQGALRGDDHGRRHPTRRGDVQHPHGRVRAHGRQRGRAGLLQRDAVASYTVSYTTLMKAFAASGQPKVAHKVFEEMERDPRVTVDRAAWNMLVEGYCRLGLLETAKQVVERMKERGVQPDVATYGSLAKGIAVAQKPGEALVLWNEVKEAEEADEELLEALADVCVRAAFFKKALEIVACMEEKGIAPNKTKYKKMYIEMHSRMFTSKHASQAQQDRRRDRKRAVEAFKFWLGLPNSYYGSEWRIDTDQDPS